MPKYMVDKSFGKSLYSSDFDGEKVSWPFVTNSEVQCTCMHRHAHYAFLVELQPVV